MRFVTMTLRQCTSLKTLRRDVTENLIIEISSIGIFTSLTQKELSKVIRQIVELSSVESDFTTLKRQAIEKLI